MIARATDRLYRENVVGLNIEDGLITAALAGVRTRGWPALTKVAATRYDPGVNGAGLSAALRAFWRRAGLRSGTVNTCIHVRTLRCKHVRLPRLEDHEIEPVIHLEAEQALQLPPGEIAVDFTLFAPTPDQEAAGEREGFLVAAPRKDIGRHLDLLERANLYPVSLEAPGPALANLYLSLRGEEETEATALLAFSAFRAHLVVFDGPRFAYPHAFPCPAASWPEAVEPLTEEVTDALRHVQYALRHAPVRRLVVSACEELREAVVGPLAERTRLEVVAWDPLEHFALSASVQRALRAMDETTRCRLSLSLGLALRGVAGAPL